MRRRKEDEGQGDGKGEVFAEVIGGEPMFPRPLKFQIVFRKNFAIFFKDIELN